MSDTNDLGRVLADQALAVPVEPCGLAPSGFDPSRTFAERWWALRHEQSRWEDRLGDLLPEYTDFTRIGTDDYDCSLEIHGVTNSLRLSAELQTFIRDAGFGKVYVNHEDGWETHYTFPVGAELPVRGWRRRYVSDAQAATTNVIAGPENNGYFEISYWPEGWDNPRTRDWLTTGYMRIVPDPLDPFASVDTHPEGGDALAAPFMSGAVRDSADAMQGTPNAD